MARCNCFRASSRLPARCEETARARKSEATEVFSTASRSKVRRLCTFAVVLMGTLIWSDSNGRFLRDSYGAVRGRAESNPVKPRPVFPVREKPDAAGREAVIGPMIDCFSVNCDVKFIGVKRHLHRESRAAA